MLSIKVVNENVTNIKEWLLQKLLLPYYLKLKNSNFAKKLGAALIECDFFEIQF